MDCTTLIIPAAGKSTRYDGTCKWQLLCPTGRTMLQQSIFNLNLDNVEKIVITIVKHHVYDRKYIDKRINQIEGFTKRQTQLLVLEDWTKNQPDTVYQSINLLNIQGPIFIKDVDGFFHFKPRGENAVCVKAGLNDPSKSYVTTKKGIVLDIAEKSVISNIFCVGGYSFKDAREFASNYEKLAVDDSLYVSHIIKRMLVNNRFAVHEVQDFTDLGTSKEWKEYIK